MAKTHESLRGACSTESSLDELGIKCGTDKSSIHHDYCRIYEQYLGGLRQANITLLELGYGGHEDPAKGGESARMWCEYFPHANIYVLDNERKEDIPDGITFIHASQTDKGELERRFEETLIDVCIDDASHLSSLTIKSFEIIFPLLKSGGLYVVEDTHSSLHDHYYGIAEANKNPRLNGAKTITALNYFKALTDAVNNDLMLEQYRLPYDVEFIHFYKDLVIIKKK